MSAKAGTALRIFLGVFMILFGLDKFLHFIPIPPVIGDGGTLMDIYASSGFLSIIGILQILGGLALIIKKFAPLALTILIAIMFNAIVFHILHNLPDIGGSAFGLLLGLVNVYANKERFSSLLSV